MLLFMTTDLKTGPSCSGTCHMAKCTSVFGLFVMEDIYETGGPNNQEDATFVAKGENGQVGLMNSDRL